MKTQLCDTSSSLSSCQISILILKNEFFYFEIGLLKLLLREIVSIHGNFLDKPKQLINLFAFVNGSKAKFDRADFDFFNLKNDNVAIEKKRIIIS